jgi:hypothetical protein
MKLSKTKLPKRKLSKKINKTKKYIVSKSKKNKSIKSKNRFLHLLSLKTRKCVKNLFGGVLQNRNDFRSNFFSFLEKAQISLLSNKSKFGIIMKADINDPSYESPYYMFRSKNFGAPIKTLVFKICPIVNDFYKRPIFMIGGKEKKFTVLNNFFEEYYKQLYVALDSCKYLETICPFPIYVDSFKLMNRKEDDFSDFAPILQKDSTFSSQSSSDSLSTLKTADSDYVFDDEACIDLLIKKTEAIRDDEDDYDYDSDGKIEYRSDDDFFGGSGDAKSILTTLKERLELNVFDSIGIFVMELADGYSTLNSLNGHPRISTYRNMARLEIITMAIEQEVCHGDFHTENIMVSPNYEGYYEGIDGKALIIDFGEIHKLEKTIVERVKTLFASGNIREVLNLIYNYSITKPDLDEDTLMERTYLWFKTINNDDINEIKSLMNRRITSEFMLVNYSKEIRKMNPETSYPELPIKLINYTKMLPKMVHNIFSGGGNKGSEFYQPISGETINDLISKITKTITNSVGSFMDIYNREVSHNNTKIKTNPIMINQTVPHTISVYGGRHK